MSQLFSAYHACRKRKRTTESALAFEIEQERYLLDLHAELIEGRWKPSPAIMFVVLRPKAREVWAATFRDRVVHHLLHEAIAPLFEPAFIVDSCASIKERGTLYGADRLERHLRSATQNWSREVYVLKADISNFFVSIRHDVLRERLRRKIRDLTMLDLCDRLIDQDLLAGAEVRSSSADLAKVPRHKSLFHAPKGQGLPIGNLPSQFFANVYLDSLAQLVKRELGQRHYVRYVDDFIIVNEDPRELNRVANAIRAHLAEIGLALAEHKTSIEPARKGVDFVGHVIRPHRRAGRPKTLRAAIERLQRMPREDLAVSTASYLGHYKHFGSHRQLEQIARGANRRGLYIDRDLRRVVGERKKGARK